MKHLLIYCLFYITMTHTWANTPILCKKIFEAKTQYLTQNMDSQYKNEEGVVKYLRGVERSETEMFIANNKAVNSKGETITIEDGLYVMDRHGKIFVHALHPDIYRSIHHSSLLAGEPVASAGKITIENGLITFINNLSGHYKPEIVHFNQFISEIESRGADLSTATISPYALKTSD